MSVGPATTVEGLERGCLLVGSLDKEGPKRLFFVTKAVGKHQVEAETHVGDALVQVKLRTNSINRANSRWQRVRFAPQTGLAPGMVGAMLKGYESEVDDA